VDIIGVAVGYFDFEPISILTNFFFYLGSVSVSMISSYLKEKSLRKSFLEGLFINLQKLIKLELKLN
jgi:hypothetical protein